MNKLYIIVVLLLLNSCQKETKINKVVIQKQYSLELPDYLSKATNLNEDASLQYQNLFKEFYVIVIDESKSEINTMIDAGLFENNPTKDVTGYANIIINNTKKTTELLNSTDFMLTKTEGLPTSKIYFDSKVENLDVFFQIAFIEGKDTYYQIMLWTLLKNKTKYLDDMDKIVSSFKEEKPKKRNYK